MKLKVGILTILSILLLPTLTYAVFFDKETSSNNTFSATTLDTNLSPSTKIEKQIEETEVEISLVLTNTGSLSTQNRLQITDISNISFASKIWTEVFLGSSTTSIYSGYLDSLLLAAYLTLTSTQANQIRFTFSISPSDYLATPEETVTFKIQNYAWQTTLPYGSGFFDKEDVEIQLTNPLPAPSPALEFAPYNPFNLL